MVIKFVIYRKIMIICDVRDSDDSGECDDDDGGGEVSVSVSVWVPIQGEEGWVNTVGVWKQHHALS